MRTMFRVGLDELVTDIAWTTHSRGDVAQRLHRAARLRWWLRCPADGGGGQGGRTSLASVNYERSVILRRPLHGRPAGCYRAGDFARRHGGGYCPDQYRAAPMSKR